MSGAVMHDADVRSGPPSAPGEGSTMSFHDIDEARLRAALARWPGMRDASVRLLHVSENVTLRVRSADGTGAVLRVGRPGYRTRHAVRSELAFMDLFRREVAAAPAPIAGSDGQLVQQAKVGTGAAPQRLLVLFTEAPGAPAGAAGSTEPLFERLGAVAARAHLAAARWKPPAGFIRPRLVPDTILPPAGPWGDWRQAPGVDPAISVLLARAEALVRRRLARFGTAIDRFGLIHADIYGDNVLVDGDRLTIVDFDDCGFGWHLYDLAASLSWLEARPIAEALRAAWLEGYRRVRPLPPADIAEAETLIMLRRLVLLAWAGTHPHTRLAATHADGFAAGSARIAERFLGRLG